MQYIYLIVICLVLLALVVVGINSVYRYQHNRNQMMSTLNTAKTAKIKHRKKQQSDENAENEIHSSEEDDTDSNGDATNDGPRNPKTIVHVLHSDHPSASSQVTIHHQTSISGGSNTSKDSDDNNNNNDDTSFDTRKRCYPKPPSDEVTCAGTMTVVISGREALRRVLANERSIRIPDAKAAIYDLIAPKVQLQALMDSIVTETARTKRYNETALQCLAAIPSNVTKRPDVDAWIYEIAVPRTIAYCMSLSGLRRNETVEQLLLPYVRRFPDPTIFYSFSKVQHEKSSINETTSGTSTDDTTTTTINDNSNSAISLLDELFSKLAYHVIFEDYQKMHRLELFVPKEEHAKARDRVLTQLDAIPMLRSHLDSTETRQLKLPAGFYNDNAIDEIGFVNHNAIASGTRYLAQLMEPLYFVTRHRPVSATSRELAKLAFDRLHLCLYDEYIQLRGGDNTIVSTAYRADVLSSLAYLARMDSNTYARYNDNLLRQLTRVPTAQLRFPCYDLLETYGTTNTRHPINRVQTIRSRSEAFSLVLASKVGGDHRYDQGEVDSSDSSNDNGNNNSNTGGALDSENADVNYEDETFICEIAANAPYLNVSNDGGTSNFGVTGGPGIPYDTLVFNEEYLKGYLNYGCDYTQIFRDFNGRRITMGDDIALSGHVFVNDMLYVPNTATLVPLDERQTLFFEAHYTNSEQLRAHGLIDTQNKAHLSHIRYVNPAAESRPRYHVFTWTSDGPIVCQRYHEDNKRKIFVQDYRHTFIIAVNEDTRITQKQLPSGQAYCTITVDLPTDRTIECYVGLVSQISTTRTTAAVTPSSLVASSSTNSPIRRERLDEFELKFGLDLDIDILPHISRANHYCSTITDKRLTMSENSEDSSGMVSMRRRYERIVVDENLLVGGKTSPQYAVVANKKYPFQDGSLQRHTIVPASINIPTTVLPL